MRWTSGLRWATVASRPQGLPAKQRARGAKAQGLRYERKLLKSLPTGTVHGQWFLFEDLYGRNFCQTDFLIDLGSEILLLEAKYTWVADGHVQVAQYLPVVRMALTKPIIAGIVCKILTPEMPRSVETVSTLEGLIIRAQQRRVPVLHWTGQSLGPLPGPRPQVHKSLIELAHTRP